MRTERVSFEANRSVLRAWLRLPDTGKPPYPAVVQGPGWLGIAGTTSYLPYHEAFTDAGYAVLVFDYRGFGESLPLTNKIDLQEQVNDWLGAVDFVRELRNVDASRLAVFGSGATGGGNAVIVAARSDVKAAVCQVPICDGADWLRRMRSDAEWDQFMERVERDRKRRAEGYSSEQVSPREDVAPTPAQDRREWKSDVVSGVPEKVELASVDSLLSYRPIDDVACISGRPIMLIAVEDDNVTPTDHCMALYERAGRPKTFLMQKGTSHYAAYSDFRNITIPLIIEWLNDYVKTDIGAPDTKQVIELRRPR